MKSMPVPLKLEDWDRLYYQPPPEHEDANKDAFDDDFFYGDDDGDLYFDDDYLYFDDDDPIYGDGGDEGNSPSHEAADVPEVEGKTSKTSLKRLDVAYCAAQCKAKDANVGFRAFNEQTQTWDCWCKKRTIPNVCSIDESKKTDESCLVLSHNDDNTTDYRDETVGYLKWGKTVFNATSVIVFSEKRLTPCDGQKSLCEPLDSWPDPAKEKELKKLPQPHQYWQGCSL